MFIYYYKHAIYILNSIKTKNTFIIGTTMTWIQNCNMGGNTFYTSSFILLNYNVFIELFCFSFMLPLIPLHT